LNVKEKFITIKIRFPQIRTHSFYSETRSNNVSRNSSFIVLIDHSLLDQTSIVQ